MEWEVKINITIGYIALTFCILQCANGQNGAYEFIANLYSNYQNDTTGFSSIDPVSIDTIFSPDFLNIMRRYELREKEGLGYDPVCDCQDDDGFRMKKIDMYKKKGITFARVHFKIFDTEFKVNLKLVRKGEKWLVDDIITSRGSLATLLEKSEGTMGWTDTTIGSWYLRLHGPGPMGQHPVWEGPVEIGNKPDSFFCKVDLELIDSMWVGSENNILMFSGYSGSNTYHFIVNVDSCSSKTKKMPSVGSE